MKAVEQPFRILLIEGRLSDSLSIIIFRMKARTAYRILSIRFPVPWAPEIRRKALGQPFRVLSIEWRLSCSLSNLSIEWRLVQPVEYCRFEGRLSDNSLSNIVFSKGRLSDSLFEEFSIGGRLVQPIDSCRSKGDFSERSFRVLTKEFKVVVVAISSCTVPQE